ncbi:MAG: beta-N-acetylglucosaminidase [Mucilaginibacter sp.]|nr:beta-N-acetylglucosaminidase [Mucilaginibacter sp.]
MRKNKCRCFYIILLAFILFNSACAQSPGLAYVNEEEKVEKSIVLLNNDKYLVPLRSLETLKAASVHFSNRFAAGFDSLLNKYSKVDPFSGDDYLRTKSMAKLAEDLKLYNTIIVQLTDADLINPQIINFIITAQTLKNIIVVFNGQGIALAKLNDVTAPVIWTERTSEVAAFYSAQAIFGGVAITSKLTDNYAPRYRTNMGFVIEKMRLQYTVPEDAGINAANLQAIDEIAREAMRNHATPGCAVLVAKDGKVIFNKAYGYHTYSPEMPDKISDIFDLASLTKTTATTMEAMRLYEEGKLELDSTVGHYIALARTTNKNNITIRELLMHQAGLVPDVATYERLKPSDYRPDSSAAYPTKVSDSYYLRKNYFQDVMWPEMLRSSLRTRGQYVYSDLSMYFMKEIMETITSIPLNVYVQQQFYTPLGMQTAGFLPLNRFKKDRIVPTEIDDIFRHSLVHGYVQDQGAAMVGGVSGHAGLFANTNDLAILYQMILNRGTYGGEQYFKPETVDLFTAKQTSVSRRGLGFDRWDPLTDHHYPSELASPQTYGHTGYTGTCVWVDPKYNLVYVFLSNRVYPKDSSNKLSSMRIRPRIQDVVYQAIEKGL